MPLRHHNKRGTTKYPLGPPVSVTHTGGAKLHWEEGTLLHQDKCRFLIHTYWRPYCLHLFFCLTDTTNGNQYMITMMIWHNTRNTSHKVNNNNNNNKNSRNATNEISYLYIKTFLFEENFNNKASEAVDLHHRSAWLYMSGCSGPWRPTPLHQLLLIISCHLLYFLILWLIHLPSFSLICHRTPALSYTFLLHGHSS